MTGKEKIHYLISQIIKKQEQLVSGNLIILRSDELAPTLTLDEQKQVLSKLTKDKGIKYEISPVYKSFQDIEPRTRLDIAEISAMNDEVTEQDLEDELLGLVNYKIEVLNLKDMAQAKAGTHKITFDPKTSTLFHDGEECSVPDGTLQHYTCKLVFKNRNVPVAEQDIIDAAGFGDNSQRPIYDATIAVNRRIFESFGIKNYLKDNVGKVRINRIYQG